MISAPVFINTRKSTALFLGGMPCTWQRHRGQLSCELGDKPEAEDTIRN
jgi:hypothetical protein